MISKVEPKVALFWEFLDDGRLKCLACERICKIRLGSIGICGNYANMDSKLINLGYGLLSAIESRPIEIKPFFHYWPGSTSLTFSNYGCNFYCPWCQNHHISFRRPTSEDIYFPPERLIKLAITNGDEGICASFTEPSTQVDYLIDVFSLASKQGLYSTIVTNCYFTERALSALMEAGANGFSVDIKGCPKAHKSILKGVNPVVPLRNAKIILNNGGHVETVFLMVPGFNDSAECIEWIIKEHLDVLGEDIPLHINRYHPAHRYIKPPTSLSKLLEAKKKAEEMGVKFVYIGNTGIWEFESTKCPKCSKMLIVRQNARVSYYGLSDNKCPRCDEKIPIRGKYINKFAGWERFL
ncbi:MAG: radical SAM protein [Nitrososphaerales archaeon]